MLSCRTAPWYAVALIVALLGVPATAAAATPPLLESPASGASSFKEGDPIRFEWRGALQGDPDTLGRSFFRLEITAAADMPSGAQSEWTKLENFVPTEAGRAVTELEVGVPSAGTYRWRVCAWGVVDDLVANEIVQLPGGCSASRPFETKAVADASHTVGELQIEEKVQVPGRVQTVVVNRPDPNAGTDRPAAPADPAPRPVAEAEPFVPAVFSDVRPRSVRSEGSALGLGSGESPLATDSVSSSERQGLTGTVLGGLSASLPLIPIPFWTLALLLAAFPVARLWRSDVLSMFDWNDGTLDGTGDIDHLDGELAPVPVASDLKVHSMTADADAPAQTGTTFAPGRGRRAA